MSDVFVDAMREAFELRERRVEERIRKLLSAGVPANSLQLLIDRSCRCSGAGVIVEMRHDATTLRECPECLGVAIIEDHRDSNGARHRYRDE